MGNKKDRKFKRIESLNLVSFTHLDQNMNPDYEGAARTLDISENGILLEFFRPFNVHSFMDMEIAIKDSIINVKGKIVNVSENGDKFKLGIEFIEISQEDRKIIRTFLFEDD